MFVQTFPSKYYKKCYKDNSSTYRQTLLFFGHFNLSKNNKKTAVINITIQNVKFINESFYNMRCLVFITAVCLLFFLDLNQLDRSVEVISISFSFERYTDVMSLLLKMLRNACTQHRLTWVTGGISLLYHSKAVIELLMPQNGISQNRICITFTDVLFLIASTSFPGSFPWLGNEVVIAWSLSLIDYRYIQSENKSYLIAGKIQRPRL